MTRCGAGWARKPAGPSDRDRRDSHGPALPTCRPHRLGVVADQLEETVQSSNESIQPAPASWIAITASAPQRRGVRWVQREQWPAVLRAAVLLLESRDSDWTWMTRMHWVPARADPARGQPIFPNYSIGPPLDAHPYRRCEGVPVLGRGQCRSRPAWTREGRRRPDAAPGPNLRRVSAIG